MMSIIIITLNEENYLGNLLSDLVNQSEKPDEVILVDANSKDHTIKVAQSFQKKLDLSIIQSKKQNASFQRNKGARKAKGDFLMFLDADMRIYHKDFLKKISVLSKKYQVLLPKIKIDHANLKEKSLELIITMTLFLSRILRLHGARGGCMIVKKSLFLKVSGFNENLRIAEDVEIARRLKKYTNLHYSQLTLFESPRRYRTQGIVKTLLVWCRAGFFSFFSRKKQSYAEIR